MPSSVESRIIAFLGCLSAQQSFILRVMSVIGTQGVEAELLEVRKRQSTLNLYYCSARKRFTITILCSSPDKTVDSYNRVLRKLPRFLQPRKKRSRLRSIGSHPAFQQTLCWFIDELNFRRHGPRL